MLAGGRQVRVALIDPLASLGAGAVEGLGEISAPMHGRLIALAVAEGDLVVEGQRVVVVEAMKMEHALTAPHAGRVADLAAGVGEAVEQGQILMKIEKIDR